MQAVGAVAPPGRLFLWTMHLLYVDDSGSVSNPQDRHVVLAGLAVFERQTHWISKRLDDLAATLWPDNPSALEFRGADILSGKKHWRGLQKGVRENAYKTALQILANSQHVRIFGSAIHKASVSPEDPMEKAFETIANRFDRFLGRLHSQNDTQRGLIILDESAYETSLQKLARIIHLGWRAWCNPLIGLRIRLRDLNPADFGAHAHQA